MTAASTMGKMQYPSTHTHWKNEIFPPSNLVFIVTTKDPPHMIRKTMPNSLPFELMPMLRILSRKTSTGKGGGRGEAGPRDPLSLQYGTVSKLFDAFGVALHVELGNYDVFELGEDVLEIAGLHRRGDTMVAQTSSSRVSLWALTYACIVQII